MAGLRTFVLIALWMSACTMQAGRDNPFDPSNPSAFLLGLDPASDAGGSGVALTITSNPGQLVEGSSESIGLHFSGVLDSAVSVTVSSDSAALLVNGSSSARLDFVADQATVSQAVQLTAAEDANGTSETVLISAVPDGGGARSIEVRVADNDIQAILMSAPLLVKEGSVDTVNVRLAFEPLGTTAVQIAADDPAIAVTPATLSFEPHNYMIQQQATLTGVSDANSVSERVVITGSGPGMPTAQADLEAVDDDANFARIVSGGQHNCVLYNNGSVRCWGDNKGQLGYGHTTTVGNASTAGFVALGGTVTQITAGWEHNCVRYDNATVRCWGTNELGVLGLGHLNKIGDDETPATEPLINVGGNVTKIVTGTHHTCVLLDTGKVRCWGKGADGAIGYGNANNIGDDEVPAVAGDVNLGGNAVDITAGYYHTCVIMQSNRAVRCWGRGQWGRLGYGDSLTVGGPNFPNFPYQVGDVDLGGKPVLSLVAGGDHTCAITTDYKLYCWGLNTLGQLGYGHTSPIGDDETPFSAGPVDIGGDARHVALGHANTCVILANGSLRCWGWDGVGQLGDGLPDTNIGMTQTPASVLVLNFGVPVHDVSVGLTHICAILADDRVRCWGNGWFGQMGWSSWPPGPWAVWDGTSAPDVPL